MRGTIEERFWARVDKSPNAKGCWNWKAGGDSDGYGQLNVNGKTIRVHRYSFLIHKGEIPEGFGVLHTCDNPACVNPEHLYAGTQLENMVEKANRKRWNWKGKAVKLTSEQVKAIRIEYARGNTTHRKLAQKYKVGYANIRSIVTGETWKHV